MSFHNSTFNHSIFNSRVVVVNNGRVSSIHNTRCNHWKQEHAAPDSSSSGEGDEYSG